MSQTTFGVGGLCCRKCGTRCTTDSLSQDSPNLTSVTSAVRSYAASASTEERKKIWTTKMGTFETNYQRNKGITTDESLQEIENFSQHGIAPTPADIKGVPSSGTPRVATSIASRRGADGPVPKLSSYARQTLGIPKGGSGGAAFFANLDKNKRKQHF